MIKWKLFLVVSNASLFYIISSCLLRSRPGSNLIRTAIQHALTRIFETHVNDDDDAYIEELFSAGRQRRRREQELHPCRVLGLACRSGHHRPYGNQLDDGGTLCTSRSTRSSQGNVFRIFIVTDDRAPKCLCSTPSPCEKYGVHPLSLEKYSSSVANKNRSRKPSQCIQRHGSTLCGLTT